jgi:hypothetical protein
MSSSDGNQLSSMPSHAEAGAHAEDHGPPPLPEPHTPMWLPAVGAVLFLSVGLLWALSTPAKDLTETTDTPTPPAVSAAAPSKTGPKPTQPAPPPRGGAPGPH